MPFVVKIHRNVTLPSESAGCSQGLKRVSGNRIALGSLARWVFLRLMLWSIKKPIWQCTLAYRPCDVMTDTLWMGMTKGPELCFLRHGPEGKRMAINTEEFQMSFTTVLIAAFVPIGCIAVAVALMRLFDVKDATAEQVQAEAENLLAQVNREVRITRHVRAGALSSVT